jgi:hypothetical protein
MPPDDRDAEEDDSRERHPVPRGQFITDGGWEPLDVIFDVLTNHRRRFAFYYLQEQGGVGDVDSLVNQVLSWEQNQPIEVISGEEHDRVKAEFYHSHLPKLEESRLIEFDQRSETIRYADPPTILTRLLQLTKRLER